MLVAATTGREVRTARKQESFLAMVARTELADRKADQAELRRTDFVDRSLGAPKDRNVRKVVRTPAWKLRSDTEHLLNGRPPRDRIDQPLERLLDAVDECIITGAGLHHSPGLPALQVDADMRVAVGWQRKRLRLAPVDAGK